MRLWKMAKTPAWQRKEGKNPSGGLNAKGRASYNRATGGNLKAPSKKVGNKRRASFCARMKGMKKKLTSSKDKRVQLYHFTAEANNAINLWIKRQKQIFKSNEV